jgi:uncharacterized protein (TIGR03437 family)
MPSVRFLPVAVCSLASLLAADKPAPRVAPYYDAASIVNGADNQSGQFAANTIATIYGTNLAYSTAAITDNDINAGLLPIVLGSSETQVFINNYPANLYYVSPTQINFLIPPNVVGSSMAVRVTVDSLVGPMISFPLAAAAPGLFQLDATNAIATFPDGSVVTPQSPAQPGDTVVLWATGLGATDPEPLYGRVPTAAAPVTAANLTVLLDQIPVGAGAIAYAGLAPYFPGLYQINLTLPESTGSNPEIRVQVENAVSIPNVHLPLTSN